MSYELFVTCHGKILLCSWRINVQSKTNISLRLRFRFIFHMSSQNIHRFKILVIRYYQNISTFTKKTVFNCYFLNLHQILDVNWYSLLIISLLNCIKKFARTVERLAIVSSTTILQSRCYVRQFFLRQLKWFQFDSFLI